MKAMILAAGRGIRMGELTSSQPKPLLKVGNDFLIVHRLKALRQAGISDVIINVSYLAPQIMQALGDGSRYDLSIHYSIESEGTLGTGGGDL